MKPREHIFVKPEVVTRSAKRSSGKRPKWLVKKSDAAPSSLVKEAEQVHRSTLQKGKIYSDPDMYFFITLSDSLRSPAIRNTLQRLLLEIVEPVDDTSAKVRVPLGSYPTFLANLEKSAKYVVKIRESTLKEKIEKNLMDSMESHPDLKFHVNIEISSLRKKEWLEELLQRMVAYLTQEQSGSLEEAYRSKRFVLLTGDIFGRSLRAIAEDVDSISRINLAGILNIDDFFPAENRPFSNLQSVSNLVGDETLGTLPPVCVIDSGLNQGHALIRNYVLDTLDLDNSTTSSCEDVLGHGSLVSGLAVYEGKVQGGRPVCSLIAVKLFNTRTFSGNYVGGIRQAVLQFKERCRVFNLSFGSNGPDPTSTRALDQLAFENNVLFVAAAGNILPKTIDNELDSGGNYPDYIFNYHIYSPGDCYNALTVGSYAEKASNLAPRECPSPFTRSQHPYCFKVCPEVLASGGNLNRIMESGRMACRVDGCGVISTSHVDNNLMESVGTSLSSPIVASVIAQLMRKFPNHWPCFYKALLVNSSRQSPDLDRFPSTLQGFGIPDKPAALNSEYWRASLCAEAAFDLRDMKRYHRYKMFFPDAADRIRVTVCFDVDQPTSRLELPYSLSFRAHKPATQRDTKVRPRVIVPKHESNIVGFEFLVHRGGKGTWTLDVLPHLREILALDSERPELRYAIVMTIISDRRAQIYPQIWSAMQKISPPAPVTPITPITVAPMVQA